MNFTFHRAMTTAAAVLGAMLAGGGALAVGVVATTAARASAGTATAPPWEPDPNSVGGLIFYNAAGQVITGGNINDSPIAAYVEGTEPVRAGDTKATLFGYLPVQGEVPGDWSGEQLSSSTVYPNTAAPAPLNALSLPVVTGASGDETVSQLETDFPNNDTSADGYAGMYVLRLKTSTPGQPGNTTYDSADIVVDAAGGTWTVVYSRLPQVATTTALSLTPRSAVYHGSKVKLSANVSPSAAAGVVEFLDGSKILKTVAVSSASASYSTTGLVDGVHKFSATFVPTDPNSYTSSTSSEQSLKITAHPTTTSIKASKSKITKGQKLTLTAQETPAASGSIAFYDGKTKLASVKVSKGIARYSSTKLPAGSQSFKATFTPSNRANDLASTSKVVKVTVRK